jgi:hypothetical protein
MPNSKTFRLDLITKKTYDLFIGGFAVLLSWLFHLTIPVIAFGFVIKEKLGVTFALNVTPTRIIETFSFRERMVEIITVSTINFQTNVSDLVKFSSAIDGRAITFRYIMKTMEMLLPETIVLPGTNLTIDYLVAYFYALLIYDPQQLLDLDGQTLGDLDYTN